MREHPLSLETLERITGGGDSISGGAPSSPITSSPIGSSSYYDPGPYSTNTGAHDPLAGLYGIYGGDPLDNLYGSYAGDPLDNLYGYNTAGNQPATYEPLDFSSPSDLTPPVEPTTPVDYGTYTPTDEGDVWASDDEGDVWGSDDGDTWSSGDEESAWASGDDGASEPAEDQGAFGGPRSDETEQKFDDGSSIYAVTPEDGSSPFSYATPSPPEYLGSTTQTFDDGSTFTSYQYDNGWNLPGGSEPAFEYQTPSGDIIYDATQMSPAQAHTLEGILGNPYLHPDTRREIEGALDAWRSQHDPLQDEGTLTPQAPYPDPPQDPSSPFGVGAFGGGEGSEYAYTPASIVESSTG